MRILLVEDDFAINKSITKLLTDNHYEVIGCYDGDDALEKMQYEAIDLFILDIGIPGPNGVYLLQRIKKTLPNAAVIMISSYVDIDTIEECFSKEADEYIKKPFHNRELLLRIERLLNTKPAQTTNLPAGLHFDSTLNALMHENREIALTKKEKMFMKLLIANLGNTVDFERIEKSVWEGEAMSESALRAMVKRLRSKLPSDLIQTFKGVGYRIEQTHG